MKKDLTEMVFMLDRSGSMQPLTADTIGGFNSMIDAIGRTIKMTKARLDEIPKDERPEKVVFNDSSTEIYAAALTFTPFDLTAFAAEESETVLTQAETDEETVSEEQAEDTEAVNTVEVTAETNETEKTQEETRHETVSENADEENIETNHNCGCGILAPNKDYTVEAYKSDGQTLGKTSIPAEGTKITAVIKGNGSYTGTAEAAYSVRGTAVIKVRSKAYTGDAVTLTQDDIESAYIKTNAGRVSIKYGEDYEIAAYSSNIKKGTAVAFFKGKGNYAGEKAVKFKIDAVSVENDNTTAAQTESMPEQQEKTEMGVH